MSLRLSAPPMDSMNSRCGFIAAFPNVVLPGTPLYIEVETGRHEVGFRNVPAAKLDGMAAIKRILDCFSPRFDEVQRLSISSAPPSSC